METNWLKYRWLLAVALAAMVLTASAETLMAPMRDGVKLATDVYLPAGDGPWPVVLTRTPYNKKPYGGRSAQYTDHGYAFVAQDVRGKFESEGTYNPFEDDMNDGYDTVEWIAQQPFCDGKIGMTGASAMGITSNLAAAANPPHLVCAFVIVAPQSLFTQSRFIGGIFKESHAGGWMRQNGVPEAEINLYKKRAVMDERWKSTDFVHFMHNVDIPIYNVGGWYDIFLQGNIDNYMFQQEHGKEGAAGNQKLRMGPFGHGNLSGDLEYPEAGGLAQFGEDEIRWFDHWLKGIDNGIMAGPPVQYYMMASARKGHVSDKNRWIAAEAWPPPSTPTRFYLAQGRALSNEPSKYKKAKTTYTADPNNPIPTVGGNELLLEKGPMDQRAIPQRADYVRFETGPLKNDVIVAGPMSFEMYASTDGPDTDFMVKLVDVYPDGYEAIVMDIPLRARFRSGRNAEDVKMMTPGEVTFMVIDLWSTALTFEKGHKIAVHLSSSNYPRFEVNPNNGAAPGDTSVPPRVATNTIYHDALNPSALVLPVVDPGTLPVHQGD